MTIGQRRYKLAHTIAKVIVTTLVVMLLILETKTTNIVSVVVWIWGVNPIAHAIEIITGCKHKHDWL